MLVGVGDGMHDADSLADELQAEFGRRIDQQVSLGEPQHNATAGSVVLRIRARADRAAAADHRHSVRGPGSQENQLSADVSTDGL